MTSNKETSKTGIWFKHIPAIKKPEICTEVYLGQSQIGVIRRIGGGRVSNRKWVYIQDSSKKRTVFNAITARKYRTEDDVKHAIIVAAVQSDLAKMYCIISSSRNVGQDQQTRIRDEGMRTLFYNTKEEAEEAAAEFNRLRHADHRAELYSSEDGGIL